MNKIFFLLFLFFPIWIYAQEAIEKINLGPKVNTIYKELRPAISADGKTLFWVLEGSPENRKYAINNLAQDLWFSRLDSSGNWGKAEHGHPSLNLTVNNAVVWVSPDAKRVLLNGTFEDAVFKNIGVSMSNKTAYGWSRPTPLDIKGYADMNHGIYTTGTMGNNGKSILLSFSEVPEDRLSDIYVSLLEENGSWSKPMNLGEKIDSKTTDDHSPFLASDGITLYYSTDRAGGSGSCDIWKSTRLDDTWLNWSDPAPLGSPINTKEWDAYFTIDASGEFAYMVSQDNSIGGSDIVKIRLKENEKPKPVVLVSGKAYNAKTKVPISASLFYETLPDGKNAGNAISNSADGSYKIILPYGKQYGYHAKADGYLAVNQNLDLTEIKPYQEINQDLYLVPIEVGQSITLNNVFFVRAASELLNSSYPELDRLAKILSDNPSIEIELGGHTDNIGDYDAKIELSSNRVKAVKDYLISKGIKNERIQGKGYGDTKPVASNASEETRKLNRRVEFIILKK